MNIKIPTNLFGVDGKEALERILAEKDETSAPEELAIQPADSKIIGAYDMIKAGTYPKALAALQKMHKAGKCASQPTFVLKDGSVLARPLTFSETVRARVTDYNTLTDANGKKRSDSDRLALFREYLDTSTGIAYKAGSTLFKILPPADDLMGLDAKFEGSSIAVDYSKLKGGIELDSSNDLCDQSLTKQQVLNHEAWNTLVNDKALLKEYADLAYLLMRNPEQAMAFWTNRNRDENHLRALALGSLDHLSYACGRDDLSYIARFVRVNPP